MGRGALCPATTSPPDRRRNVAATFQAPRASTGAWDGSESHPYLCKTTACGVYFVVPVTLIPVGGCWRLPGAATNPNDTGTPGGRSVAQAGGVTK